MGQQVWRIKAWRTGPDGLPWLSNSEFYRRLADPRLAPRTRKIGRTRVVTESPLEYAERIEAEAAK